MSKKIKEPVLKTFLLAMVVILLFLGSTLLISIVEMLYHAGEYIGAWIAKIFQTV
jgi:hypothetical protein